MDKIIDHERNIPKTILHAHSEDKNIKRNNENMEVPGNICWSRNRL